MSFGRTRRSGLKAELTLVFGVCSFDGVLRIVKDEGVAHLFRGVGPNVARAVLMNASQLAT